MKNKTEMILVEGGTYTMGETEKQVTVKDFYIGKYPVTQKQWFEIMGSNPSYFKGCDNCPVETVTWYDTQEFIKKLNEKYPGSNFRLPTEAEWEWAARGGNESKGYLYAGSNNIDDVAWYYENSGEKTHPVGQKKPNELGLYDMSGNVWEWCEDWYDEKTNWKVVRGGSWYNNFLDFLRVAFRYYSYPFNDNSFRGLRLSRD